MKNKKQLYSIASLGICSGTILINRFVISIPNWLADILILVAAVFLILSITEVFREMKKRK